MPFWGWSRTAASNATADPTCPFPEGMSGGALNDGIRAQMARLAEYRDDTAGAIVTGGTSTAYTVSSFQGFDSPAHMNGQAIAFTPHVTNNVGPVTLNVDGLGSARLRANSAGDLPAGVLIQGTPYVVFYNNADGSFYLHGFYGNPYNVPLGAGLDFWGPTAPNSSFALAQGQTISRTTYSTLFAMIGSTYGVGDGSTTFNIPDKRGRVSAMVQQVAMGSPPLSSTYFGGTPTNLGAVGGGESHTLTTTEMPAHSHANTLNETPHTHGASGLAHNTGQLVTTGNGTAGQGALAGGTTDSATTGITITNASVGSGSAHNIVQPTIICNYIIRVI